ncbi:MAG: shikimate kinase [Candidatus Binataceae bacterium]|nr:shikimate kinase [Candidatus Binataceae bacterium]
MEPKLVLTGFMGTGKSRVGRVAAERLGWRFVDSDREISAREGKSIPEIFAIEGETSFRAIEREVIAAIASDPAPAVIATGGGAIADAQNLRILEESGIVICLTANPQVITERVARSSTIRPKLLEGGQPLLERVMQLLDERAPIYARAAATVDTSETSIEESAERLLDTYFAIRNQRCKPSV